MSLKKIVVLTGAGVSAESGLSTFRDAGGGTGKSLDIDEFDTMEVPFQQLIVWDPVENEIVGGYRFIHGRDLACEHDNCIHSATAELFDAAEALRIGLLHQVVAPDQLDAAVQRQVDLLLKAGPVASASAKTLVRDVVAHADGARHDADNAALIARLRVSPEGQEGLSAFLDKRKPAWIAE